MFHLDNLELIHLGWREHCLSSCKGFTVCSTINLTLITEKLRNRKICCDISVLNYLHAFRSMEHSLTMNFFPCAFQV
jgi:hypothetical protein